MSLFNDPEFLSSLSGVESKTQQPVESEASEIYKSLTSDTLPTPPSYITEDKDKPKSLFDNPDFINTLSSKNPTVSKPEVVEEKYTVADLRRDSQFMSKANNFLKGIGANENIFEYLRDSEYSLSSAVVRSFQVGNWTDQQKRDYSYLRNVFRNANLSSTKERLIAAKDIGIDIIADPLNILSVLFAIPTMGGSTALNATATQLAKEGVKKLTHSQLTSAGLQAAKKPAIYGAAEGVVWAGPYEYFSQSTDVDLGLRDDIDWNMVGAVAGLGGVIGGGFTGAIGGLSGAKYFDKTFKYANEQEIIDEAKKFVGPLKEDDSTLLRKLVEKHETAEGDVLKASTVENLIAVTIGKSATKYLKLAEASEPMEAFLKTLRSDLRRITGERKPGVKETTYGETLGRLFGYFHTNLDHSLNKLDKEFKLNRFKTVISKEENEQLFMMLATEGKFAKTNPVKQSVKEAYFGDGNKRIGLKSLLEKAFTEGNKVGLFAMNQKIKNYFPHKFNYSKIVANRTELRDLIIEYNHAEPINKIKPQKFYDANGVEMEGIPKGALAVDKESFGRNFLEDANNNIDRARKLKADAIIDGMLENRWTPYEFGSANNMGAGYGFMKHRVFNIPDDKLMPFLETDVRLVLQDYFTNLSQGIARTKYYGRTKSDFDNKFVIPIQDDLMLKGMPEEEARKVGKGIRDIYGKVTGLDTDYIENKALRGMSNWGRLSQQMAHLPLATLSSITEPLILLSRVGLTDTPAAIYEIGHALKKETVKTYDRAVQGIKRLSGKKTNTLKDLEDDEWREIYETGLALEQAVMDRIEGLTGEALTGEKAKGLQNMFFKANLLTQWTSAVQLASFNTGKRLLRRNIEGLYKDQQGIKKLSKAKKTYYKDQLEDLGIDVDKGLAWHKKYLKDNKFDYGKAINDDFYNDITNGANRFTKEIILNPSTSEANRPLWFSSPAGQVLMQFAGYPTVFANTVLKKFATDLKDYPTVAAPKIALTTLLMTAVAMGGNYVRSGGKNWEEQEPGELVYEAIRRWGGVGFFEYLDRIDTNVNLGGGQVASLAKAFTGPLGQDVIDSLIYRKGLSETALTNLPAYSALPKETRDKLKKFGRETDKEILQLLINEKESLPAFSRGGVVDVPNAKDEPDEMISRVTGEPFNATSESVQDVEDRALEGQLKGLGLK